MNTEQNVTLIALIIVIVCLAILFVIWILYKIKYFLNPISEQTCYVSLATIILMMWIVMFSLQIQQNYGWLAIYSLFVLLFIISYLINLLSNLNKASRLKKRLLLTLKDFWNPEKNFGGGAFGDFANAIGVLAGVGAWQLSNIGEGWFWLGQFGAFLAMIVGLSLAQRWINEPQWIWEDYKAPFWLYTHWWSILGNFAVGVFTFLALITSAASSETSVQLLRHRWLFVPQIIILLCLLISTMKHFHLSLNYTPPGDKKTFRKRKLAIFYIWIVLLTIGEIGTLIYFQMNLAPNPNWLYAVFISVAIISWISIELYLVIKMFSSFTHWSDLFKGFRSLIIITGNLLLLTLTWIIYKDNPQTFNGVQWFLFIGATVLMILATLIGVVVSAYNTAKRHAEQKANIDTYKSYVEQHIKREAREEIVRRTARRTAEDEASPVRGRSQTY